LGLAEEFIRNAQECLRLAEEANTIEAQIHWLSMAQFWRHLAVQAGEEAAAARGDLSIPDRGKSNGDQNGNGDSSTEH
jgi:hypothetical protein